MVAFLNRAKISSWADLGFNALQSAPLHDVQLKPCDRIGPIGIRNNISIEAKIDTKARIGVRTAAVESVWRPRS